MIAAEFREEQGRRLRAEEYTRTVRAQLKETEEKAQVQRIGGGEEAVAAYWRSRWVLLSLKKRGLEKEREKLLDLFFPGATKNLETAQQQLAEEEDHSTMSAAEQLIYSKKELKRVELEVLALAEWGSGFKKGER